MDSINDNHIKKLNKIKLDNILKIQVQNNPDIKNYISTIVNVIILYRILVIYKIK